MMGKSKKELKESKMRSRSFIREKIIKWGGGKSLSHPREREDLAISLPAEKRKRVLRYR